MADRRFSAVSPMPVPVDRLASWHMRPGAFGRLVPPWRDIRVVDRSGQALRDGLRLTLSLPAGPFRLRWEAMHREVDPRRGFVDEQVRGPFARWVHRHHFEDDGTGGSRLRDEIDWSPPFGPLGALGAEFVGRDLERMFAYRHVVTQADLARHAEAPDRTLRVAVSGAGGLVGAALCAFLDSGGHEVHRLVRRPARPGKREISYDPVGGTIDTDALAGMDTVVHLAGESIMGLWTEAKKARIRDSRVDSTRLISCALARVAGRPRVLVNASAVGIYGDRGDETLDETSALGVGFLADVGRAWEAATEPAEAAGVRVVRLRIGVVLSGAGGTLAALRPLFGAGLGGRIGDGRQAMSWIALDDLVALIHAALWNEALAGAVNATAPEPVTNAGFTSILARVLRRPAIAPVPAFVVRGALGEMGRELLLAGLRVLPARATAAGFRFDHSGVEGALRHTLGRRPAPPDGTRLERG